MSPSLEDIYTHNAVAWMGTRAKFVKYEDLLTNVNQLSSTSAEQYFANLFDTMGLGTLPDDWRVRIEIGADRKQSGTARENLLGLQSSIPDVLPDQQKQLVEYAVPGLRSLLGYHR